MRRIFFLAMAMLSVLSGPGVAAAPEDLVGLWESTRLLGPQVRGPLVIRRQGDSLVADIAGFAITVGREGRDVRFELPAAMGAFHGRISPDASALRGFWHQPRSRTNVNGYATPVVLRGKDGDWRGEVRPLDLTFSVYLPVAKGADGELQTYFRNPERNVGIFAQVKRLEVDGDRVRLVGNRRGNPQMRTLYEGRLDEGRLQIGIPDGDGVYTFEKVSPATSAFHPRGSPAPEYRYAVPLARDDGWPVASVEDVGVSRGAIEKFVQKLLDTPMDSVNASQIHSLLIARHGKLVVEEYFHGHHRDLPHDTRSASKSVLGTLIGAAMHAGIPIKESTPVYATLLGRPPGQIDAAKRDIRLEHLITMSGGHFCDDSNSDAPGNEDAIQEREQDWLRTFMAVPMDRLPGEKFVYCSMETYLAGSVLAKVAKEPIPELFDRLLARPMQMGSYHVFLTPMGDAYLGGGWRLLPRDFLKLSQLMLDGGVWHGQRLLGAEWVAKATSKLREVNRFQGYGYTWWATEYPYRDRKVKAFFAAGNGGQISLGVPELDLAIVFTGGNYADASLFIPQREYVPRDILPAVDLK